MIDGYTILLSLIESCDDRIGGEIKRAIESLPMGIKKAIKAQRPDCSVSINDCNWVYIKDYDGISLGCGHNIQQAGDWELDLYYNDSDMIEIEDNYRTAMAHFSKIAFVVKDGDERITEYDDYDFEITKNSLTVYTCSTYWSTNQFEFKHLDTKEITLNIVRVGAEQADAEQEPKEEVSKDMKKNNQDNSTSSKGETTKGK